ncbi:MAG: 5-formyltetrahydrofolate cyclo-ligase [Lachnospiraceae bacterium]|jgi:5-formyltetrahydrofolate cyclo-ligase|nr:5-formyltetrahydrofolate cyclo-ligase [Lachnospiraceae bacterium]
MEKKIFSGKQELRNRYLNYRNNLSMKERREKSAKIWEQLKKEDIFKQAQILLVYMDYRSEVMTTGLVEELFALQEKRIFAPKVEGMDIQFYEVTSMEDFAEGYQGIREPLGDSAGLFTNKILQDTEALILVPGAVFDRERGRMGYGKGFYDRYLTAFPRLHSAAFAFECQITRKVPMETHDIRPDLIITDTEVIR